MQSLNAIVYVVTGLLLMLAALLLLLERHKRLTPERWGIAALCIALCLTFGIDGATWEHQFHYTNTRLRVALRAIAWACALGCALLASGWLPLHQRSRQRKRIIGAIVGFFLASTIFGSASWAATALSANSQFSAVGAAGAGALSFILLAQTLVGLVLLKTKRPFLVYRENPALSACWWILLGDSGYTVACAMGMTAVGSRAWVATTVAIWLTFSLVSLGFILPTPRHFIDKPLWPRTWVFNRDSGGVWRWRNQDAEGTDHVWSTGTLDTLQKAQADASSAGWRPGAQTRIEDSYTVLMDKL